MSNKIKIKKQKLEKINQSLKLVWLQYIADMAGCGTIRCIYPSLLLNQLGNRKIQTESLYTNRFSPYPETYQKTSFVVFQRSATQQQYEMIKFLKQNHPNLPIIYEIDDSLMDIPKWNFAHEFYTSNKKHIESILRMVDGIITSTDSLKRKYLKYNKNIRVVPNHLPEFMWDGSVCMANDIGKPRICYPGSFNHFNQHGSGGDFDNELIDFVKKTTHDYQWVFVGGIPSELKNNNGIEYHPWQPILKYPKFMRSLGIDIMIAPLEHNTFNESKSNIKALESVSLGAALVCTDIEPYHNLKDPQYTTEGLIHQIQMLCANVDLRKYNWEYNYKTLKDQLYWEDDDYRNLWGYVSSYLALVGKKL